MKLKITQKQNNEIISVTTEKSSLTSFDNIEYKEITPSLSWLDAQVLPWLSSETKKVFIYNFFLKGTNIPVYLSPEGTFFFFSPEGEELVLDKQEYNWADSHVGAYYEEILKDLDYRSIELELIEN